MRVRSILAALAFGTVAGPVGAADLGIVAVAPPPVVVVRPATPDPLACNNPRVLDRIVDRFAWAERNTWRRGFVMARIDDPRLRYDILNGPSMIDHTHCQAEAVMTNDTVRKVYYIVEENMGLASIGTGVTFCVLGLDPWYVYDAACRTLR